MAGLLGALSVSLKDCYGSYEKYHNPQGITIDFGLKQVSTACLSFTVMFGVWFLILLTLRMMQIRKANVGSFFKIISLTFIMVGILGFYLILFINQN